MRRQGEEGEEVGGGRRNRRGREEGSQERERLKKKHSYNGQNALCALLVETKFLMKHYSHLHTSRTLSTYISVT